MFFILFHFSSFTATVSLISSVYCFIRSVIAVLFLYGVCYVTLIESGKVTLCFFMNSTCTGTIFCLTLLHSERPKLYGVLAILSAIGLRGKTKEKK